MDMTDREIAEFEAEQAEWAAEYLEREPVEEFVPDSMPIEIYDITEEEMERAIAEAESAFDYFKNAF